MNEWGRWNNELEIERNGKELGLRVNNGIGYFFGMGYFLVGF